MSIVEGGVRFPLHHPTLSDFEYISPRPPSVYNQRIPPSYGHCCPKLDSWHKPGFWDIHNMYSIVSTHEEGSYYLKARQKNRKLVTHTPDSTRGDNDDFFVVTGNWEERDEEGKLAELHVPHAYGRPRETPSSLPSNSTFL